MNIRIIWFIILIGSLNFINDSNEATNASALTNINVNKTNKLNLTSNLNTRIMLEIYDGRPECHFPRTVFDIPKTNGRHFSTQVSISQKKVVDQSIESSMVSIDFLTTLSTADWFLSGLDVKVRGKILFIVMQHLPVILKYSDGVDKLKSMTFNSLLEKDYDLLTKLKTWLIVDGTVELVSHVEGSPKKSNCRFQITIIARLFKDPDVYVNGVILKSLIVDHSSEFLYEYGLLMEKVTSSSYPLIGQETLSVETRLLVIFSTFVFFFTLFCAIYLISTCKLTSEVIEETYEIDPGAGEHVNIFM